MLQGKCEACGSFEELAHSDLDFISLLKEAKNDDKDDKQDKDGGQVLTRQISRQSERSVCLRSSKLVESSLSVLSAVTSPSSVYVSTVIFSVQKRCKN